MNGRRWIKMRPYAWPAIGGAFALLVLNALLNPSFVARENWAAILATATPFIITAAAQAVPVIAGNGGIDLSVGPLAGLVNALIVVLLVPLGFDNPLEVVTFTLGLGIISGLLNGMLVTIVRVQPIIATLGTYLMYQGLTLHVLPTAGGSAPAWLRAFAGDIGIVPGPLIALAILAAAWFTLEATAYRRNLFAVGGDERAAYTAGVNVTLVRLIAYVIAGIFAATAGLAFTAVLGSADPNVGTSYTLTSIAGMALGGVAFGGGRGGLLGAAAGGALLFLVQNVLTLAHVSIFYLQVAYGIILLVALAINSYSERMRRQRLAARIA